MKFDQDLCATCDMNSTLGSVVPLAMFLKDKALLEAFLASIKSSSYSVVIVS